MSLSSVWRGVENLATTGIRFPDRPTLSNYSGPQIVIIIIIIMVMMMMIVIIIIIMEKSKNTKIEGKEIKSFEPAFSRIKALKFTATLSCSEFAPVWCYSGRI